MNKNDIYYDYKPAKKNRWNERKTATIITLVLLLSFIGIGATVYNPTDFQYGIKTRLLRFFGKQTITISSDTITPGNPPYSNYRIAIETTGTTDDLTTIDTTNIADGFVMYCTQANADSTIVVKNASNNIITGTGDDFTIENGTEVQFKYDASTGNFTMIGGGGGASITGTDNAIVRVHGTDELQTSKITIDDSGNIDSGIWNGDEIGVAYGGTGKTSVTANSYLKGNNTSALVERTYSEVKQDLSLDNVENTALSTWTGTTNITTLGTIATGVYEATPIDDAYLDSMQYQKVIMGTTGSPTYDDLKDYVNTTASAGKISGGTITDSGNGEVSITAGTGMAKTTDSDIGDIKFFNWAYTTGITVADSDLTYITIQYDGTVGSDTDYGAIDFNTTFVAGLVYRQGSDVDITLAGNSVPNSQSKNCRRLYARGIERMSGGTIAEKATRYVTLTAGSFYLGDCNVVTPENDSQTDGIENYWYYNGSAWIRVTGRTQIDNTQYNNIASGLATLDNNKYGVHWIYTCMDEHEPNINIIYGQGNYTLTGAQNAQPPATVPDYISSYSILSGKIIIEKNASTFTSIQSAYTQKFTPGTVTRHNDLSGLQGGTATEYYHNTSAEYGYIQAYLAATGIDITSGLDYKIDGTSVLNATTLGSGVTASSLTSVGTIATGTWNATEIGPTKGGTGQTTYTTGDILYASASNTLAKLSAGSANDMLRYTAGGILETFTPSDASYLDSDFVDGNLSTGVLTVNHNLGTKNVFVSVKNNSDVQVLAPVTYTDTNSLTIDLTGEGTITGTWTVSVTEGGWSAGGGGASTFAELTGTCAESQGGLDMDLSSSTGYPYLTAGTGSVIKCSLSESTDPDTTMDSGEGYVVGSSWINTTAGKSYMCVDATEDAAVWNLTSGFGAIQVTLSADQSSGLSVGDEIQFDTVTGSGIEFNTTTHQATLYPGRTYEIIGKVQFVDNATQGDFITAVYDVTNSAVLGTMSFMYSLGDTTSNSSSGVSYAIVSPATIINTEMQIVTQSEYVGTVYKIFSMMSIKEIK